LDHAGSIPARGSINNMRGEDMTIRDTEVAQFLVEDAAMMSRDQMLDSFNARFPDYEGTDDFWRGLRIGVAILQMDAAERSEHLDIRGAFARLAKISRYEVEDTLAEGLAEYPSTTSTARH
jgi:hypothetical protein